MACISYGNAVIYTPGGQLRKRILRCPMCERRTEHVVRYEAWIDTTMCCRCGDSWSDGDLHERPLRRGWRKEAIRRHRRLWDQATHGPVDTAELLAEAGLA